MIGKFGGSLNRNDYDDTDDDNQKNIMMDRVIKLKFASQTKTINEADATHHPPIILTTSKKIDKDTVTEF